MKKLVACAALSWFMLLTSAGAGEATLTCTPPSEYDDGAPIGALSDYRLSYGCASSGQYDTVELIPNLCAGYTVQNLPDAGTCFFVVQACDTAGVCSDPSNEASLAMGNVPGPVTSFTWSLQGSEPGAGAQFLGLVSVDATAGNVNTTVAVPAGATLAVLQMHYWDDSGSQQVSAATLDGQAFVDVVNALHTGSPEYASGVYAGSVTGFAAGSVSLTVSWSVAGSITEGGAADITFWSGVSGVSAFDWAQGGNVDPVATTVATVPGQLVVVSSEKFIYGPDHEISVDGGASVVNVLDNRSTQNQRVDVDYFEATQATHLIEMDNESYSSMSALALD